ncbi:alpha-L-fucosidase [Cohnella silvisoli]|uniref:alpha-L-fucosidase n=1 Tax=Cohnella silvisoli TaxID=2873699 RepID=A0ABV1L0M9_9BACL|nr:alpha-L-fucosidase [Cohnella silvisoli]MCD9025368.1 alpha-L-fucosidase [Cohnella silvisoli]
MEGNQRLSLQQLQKWEALGYGMFIHFGMSTFDGEELSSGLQPSTMYAPDELDVDQWIRVAKEAGMKYAVLTTKHVSGHCLWPSKYTDYHVGTSGNPTDVVGEFVKACKKYDIMPGLYYCSYDNHHLFGSLTPSHTDGKDAYTTEEYQQFQSQQIDELLTRYGPIGEVWIDIPMILPRGYRHKLYDRIAALQPDAIIMMNHGIGDGSEFSVIRAWPTDIMAIERFLPNSHNGYDPWKEIEGKRCYMPGEVCDPIGWEWFYVDGDAPRSDEELLGMYLVARARKTNLLLDVGPDKRGKIPQHYVDSLMCLKENIIKVTGHI